MLPEQDIVERAHYCCLVCFQLNWLYGNYDLQPPQYPEYLGKSSLGLGEDDYIMQTVQEGLAAGKEDAGLNDLILMYEAFVRAFCEVLEVDESTVRESIPKDTLKKLAAEMGVELEI